MDPASDRAGELVGEIRAPRRVVARREQKAPPGLLLMPDGAELPDAKRAAHRALEREGFEVRMRVARLCVDRLPQFVFVAPARQQQEIEFRSAAVEDDEAEIPFQAQLSRCVL